MSLSLKWPQIHTQDDDTHADFYTKKLVVESLGIDFKEILLIDDRPSTQAYFRLRGATVLDPGTWVYEDKHMKVLEQYLIAHPSG